MVVQTHLHIVKHRHIMKQTYILKGSRDARLTDFDRLFAQSRKGGGIEMALLETKNLGISFGGLRAYRPVPRTPGS